MNFYSKTLFLALLATSFTLTAEPIKQDYLSKEMRELQFTSAISAFILSMKTLFSGKGIFSELPLASEAATDFVKIIAQEQEIKDSFEVRIEEGYAAGMGTILLPQDQNSYFLKTELDTALYNYHYGATSDIQNQAAEELFEHIGSIDHELTHFKNHDTRNSLIFSALLNLTLITSYLTFEYKVLAPHLKNMGGFKKWLYACGSGLGLSALSTLVDTWTRRLREKRADEGVRNDPEVLKAMINWTIRDHEIFKKMLNTSPSRFWRLVGAWIEKYPCLYFLLDPVHPPLPERQARFQERLDALELTV